MSVRNTILFLFLGFCQICHGKYGFRGEQEWGFVTVRPSANIFYWLHYTTANVSSYTEKPLIIWLEGGPGVSSTGYTNFKEIGPFYLNLTSRSNSLVKDYNILFIDSPVGTGFSYVDSNEGIPKTDKQVAMDLLTLIEKFFNDFPNLSNVPTYIVGQSYGGKIAVLFAYEWLQKIQNGWNITNLKGVELSSPWIAPDHSVLSMAPYLYEKGLINARGYKVITDFAFQSFLCSHMKDWKCASVHTQQTYEAIIHTVKNIYFYNILTQVNTSNITPYNDDDIAINSLMEDEVRLALNLPEFSLFESFIYQTDDYIKEQTMIPVTKEVEYLVNQPNFKVYVLNGQLDLIINPIGTLHWVENLKWKNSSEWIAARKEPLIINNSLEGYVKAYGNLRMYWVERAGHVITVENPAATRKILKDLTTDGLSN
ncbi:retinoid-inducible serine carboxypeptidase-like [Leptopilina heterotoma]|uniref:retinoid-inducible serine carboxypeptidase-like n=1 Tax=Leptopilina heterotoma TaxID=63436 RepID=UPI001CA7F81C|nr:retinoid-inducible serine carboxypeptidase-like [Leptopilina heterotoma]